METRYEITKIENGYILDYPGPKVEYKIQRRLRKFFSGGKQLLKFLEKLLEENDERKTK